MLSGDNSILKQAGRARDITGEKQIEERVYLAINSAIAKGLGILDYNNLDSELQIEFGQENYTITPQINAKSWKITMTIDGRTKNYTVNSTGEVHIVEEEAEGWKEQKDSEGKIEIVNKDGTIKLHIGDYINYNPTNNEVTSITSNETDNGYGNQKFEIENYQATNYTNNDKWRVLGVRNEQIEIISADIIPTNNSDMMFYLKGRIGFQNAETELNKVAGLYGHGAHATGARSVNVEDINKITGYNPNAVGIKNPTEEQISSGEKYREGCLDEYGYETTYNWDGSENPVCTWPDGYVQEMSNHNVTNLSYGEFQNAFSWYDYNSNSWLKSPYSTTPRKITDLTSTYYCYYPETLTYNSNSTATTGIARNSAERNMLFDYSNGEYYWLASRCISPASGDYVYFEIRSVGKYYVSATYLVTSNGWIGNEGHGVRSVVSLKKDIQLMSDGANAWKFKD